MGGGLGPMLPQHQVRIDPLGPLRGILTAKALDCPALELPAASMPALWTMSAIPRESASSVLRAFERRSLLIMSAAASSRTFYAAIHIRRDRAFTRYSDDAQDEIPAPSGTILRSHSEQL